MLRLLHTIFFILAISAIEPAVVTATTDVFPLNPGSHWIYTSDTSGGESLMVNRTLTVSGITFSEMITGLKKPFYFLRTQDSLYRFDVLPGNPLEDTPAVPTLLLRLPLHEGDTWISPWGEEPMSFTVMDRVNYTVPAGYYPGTFKIGYRKVSDPIYQGYIWLAPGVGILALQNDERKIELASFSITEFLPPEPESRDIGELASFLNISSIINPKRSAGENIEKTDSLKRIGSFLPGLIASMLAMALFFGLAIWMLGSSRRMELNNQPDVADGEMVLASAMVRDGLYSEAADIMRRLIGKNPQWPDLVAMFGKTLLKLGNFQEAVLELKRALTLNPDLTDARLDLARAYIKTDDYSRAFEELEIILADNSQFADALCLRGDVLAALGKVDQASESYNRALEINPSFTEAARKMEKLSRES